MTGQDPFDRIRTYLDIAQRAFEEIVDTYGPAEDEGFDEVQDVLDKLGVDKPAATYSDVEKGQIQDVLDTLGVDKPSEDPGHDELREVLSHLKFEERKPEPEHAGDLWEIAIRDTYNSVVEVRADKVQFGIIGLDSQDIGFTAYLDGSEVFHAPAGMYHYAKKVVE
ncbi:hypothetical protein ICV35_23830 [Rhodococcus ruber]|uniref:hypothetical protein n=1 Tax=Rhodococcus ruber TaxID=1830 RepID=UPI0017836E43|nr:hypothetical protein [Rhodococcus ruber]MBD8056682.1 hypothetical protein [Rhodococcus ruber]